MIKYKHLFSLKYFILVTLLQAVIALLFVSTIGFELEYYFMNYQMIQETPAIELKVIVIYDTPNNIKNEEEFNLIIEELENNGANVYYRVIEYSEDLLLLIDEALANQFRRTDNEANCNELALNYGESCKGITIEIHSTVEMKEILLDNFYNDYSNAMTSGIVIEYDDLDLLFSEIITKHNLEIDYEVVDINASASNNLKGAQNLIMLDRQNFIAFSLIWLLSIILSTLVYLKSKQRNISILVLLGYSNLSILSTIIVMNLISLIIPYIILIYNDMLIVSWYLLVDFILIVISILFMYFITLKSTKEKVKERI